MKPPFGERKTMSVTTQRIQRPIPRAAVLRLIEMIAVIVLIGIVAGIYAARVDKQADKRQAASSKENLQGL